MTTTNPNTSTSEFASIATATQTSVQSGYTTTDSNNRTPDNATSSFSTVIKLHTVSPQSVTSDIDTRNDLTTSGHLSSDIPFTNVTVHSSQTSTSMTPFEATATHDRFSSSSSGQSTTVQMRTITDATSFTDKTTATDGISTSHLVSESSTGANLSSSPQPPTSRHSSIYTTSADQMGTTALRISTSNTDFPPDTTTQNTGSIRDHTFAPSTHTLFHTSTNDLSGVSSSVTTAATSDSPPSTSQAGSAKYTGDSQSTQPTLITDEIVGFTSTPSNTFHDTSTTSQMTTVDTSSVSSVESPTMLDYTSLPTTFESSSVEGSESPASPFSTNAMDTFPVDSESTLVTTAATSAFPVATSQADTANHTSDTQSTQHTLMTDEIVNPGLTSTSPTASHETSVTEIHTSQMSTRDTSSVSSVETTTTLDYTSFPTMTEPSSVGRSDSTVSDDLTNPSDTSSVTSSTSILPVSLSYSDITTVTYSSITTFELPVTKKLSSTSTTPTVDQTTGTLRTTEDSPGLMSMMTSTLPEVTSTSSVQPTIGSNTMSEPVDRSQSRTTETASASTMGQTSTPYLTSYGSESMPSKVGSFDTITASVTEGDLYSTTFDSISTTASISQTQSNIATTSYDSSTTTDAADRKTIIPVGGTRNT